MDAYKSGLTGPFPAKGRALLTVCHAFKPENRLGMGKAVKWN